VSAPQPDEKSRKLPVLAQPAGGRGREVVRRRTVEEEEGR